MTKDWTEIEIEIFAPLTAMVDEACKGLPEREHIDVTMKGAYIPWPKIDWTEIEIEITNPNDKDAE